MNSTRTIARAVIEKACALADLDDDDDTILTDYQGRGSYGRQCFGVVMDRQTVFRFSVALGMVLGEQGCQGIADDAQTDNLGLDIIIYFPGWTIDD